MGDLNNTTADSSSGPVRLAFLSFALLFTLITLADCVHHEPRNSDSLFGNAFQVIGHRGTRGADRPPENTMAAFRYSANMGVGFELDTQLSRSGEMVVIHDYTVDRTTGGKGKVAELTLAQLKELDAGSYINPKFAGEKIPTLAEVLDEFGGKVKIDIEIKFKGPEEEANTVARAVSDLVEKRNLAGGVFITAFNPYVLKAFTQINPKLFRGQLYSDFETSDIPWYQKVVLSNLLLNGEADPDILAVDHKLVDADYVTTYRGYGYRIFTWTVNEKKRMRELLELGVDGIITDNPAELLQLKNELRP